MTKNDSSASLVAASSLAGKAAPSSCATTSFSSARVSPMTKKDSLLWFSSGWLVAATSLLSSLSSTDATTGASSFCGEISSLTCDRTSSLSKVIARSLRERNSTSSEGDASGVSSPSSISPVVSSSFS